MKDGSGVKINTTEPMPAPSVLKDTLDCMNEFDMNEMKDPGHNGKSPLRGSGSKP